MLNQRQPGNLNKAHRTSIYLMAIAALMWSFGGLLIKSVNWNPMAISGARSGIAALVLLIAARRLKFTWSFPQVGGAIAYVGTVSLFVVANKLTTAANSIFLQYTSPIWIALLGTAFLGERATWVDWLTIGAVMAGMALFFADDLTQTGIKGIVIAIISGFSFGCLALFLRKQKCGSPLETVILGNILTALISLPFMFGSSPGFSGGLLLLVAGVLQLGIPYLLYTIAIKHITALDAMLIATIEPILNPVWVLLAIGEHPQPWALVGGLIVILSVTIRGVLVATHKGHVTDEDKIKPVDSFGREDSGL